MMSAVRDPLVSQEYRDALAAQGRMIYDAELKPLLEPARNGEFVVIHVDTRDYAVGNSVTVAKRELRRRHPCDGRLVGMKIGPEPEFGLAARLLAAEMAASVIK